jgi:hypothetical protein
VAHLGDTFDPTIDALGDLPPKKSPIGRLPLWLVAIALISSAWAAASIYFSIRAERVRGPKAYHPTSVWIPPNSPRRLLAAVPDSSHELGLSESQIAFAMEVRAAEERGWDVLWMSHQASGPRPDHAQRSASQALMRLVQPGRQFNGWLMQAWPYRTNGMMDLTYSTLDPPGYRVHLKFPDTIAGYEIWFMGCNYDFQARTFACANKNFEALKLGDWVRVSGVLQPGSRLEWDWGKPDQELILREMTISGIVRVEAPRK